MTIPNEKFCVGMTKFQMQLYAAFDGCIRRKVRKPHFFMAEWHRRARKTTAALNLLIKEACRVPNSKYVYIAPTQVMARNIVWDDPQMLRAYLPDQREMGWKLNEQRMLVTFANGSMLKFGGSDEPDSLRGIDAIGVVLDEWSLAKENVWTEIFRPIITGPLPPHLEDHDVFRWAMFLYTPKGSNHASTMFDYACCMGEGGSLPECGPAQKMRPRWFASRLDAELSGIIDMEELALVKNDPGTPRAFYDQEYKCSRVTSEEMTLITTKMIHDLNDYHLHTERPCQRTFKIVSIDPAWGGDVCKIMGMENHCILEEKDILDKHRVQEICQAAKVVASNLSTKNFIVDVVSGPGVADTLAGDVADYNVQYFNSSERPVKKESSPTALAFVNLRAEAYHHTSELIRNFTAGEIKSSELIRQLPIASKYTTQGNSGKLIILPKAIIKKELGRSPDDTDCYVMGNWGLQFVEGEPGEDYTYSRSERRHRSERTAMDMG